MRSPVYKTKPTNWQDLPNQLLLPLVERKYIGILKFEVPKVNDPPDDWLDQIIAVIYLLPDGLLFLYEKKKIRQQQKTNNLTLAFIVVTFLVALGNYYYSSKLLDLTRGNNAQHNTKQQK